MSITLNGTTGITTPTYGGSVPSEYITPVTGFKNRIINGAMTIDQRNAGASVTIGSAINTYITDRFYILAAQASKLTAQQNAGSVTPPTGFTNYLGITSSSAYTSLSGDYFQLRQVIEGFNIADLGWGTANAKTVTLSFWVYSSLTGQFGGAIRNKPNYTYTYPFSFTISSANTWQYVTITIAGPNASQGTWNANNTAGLEVEFDLGNGSTFLSTANSWQSGSFAGVTGDVKLVGTSGATFYITGVQLEVGDTATSFDNRSIGQELSLCQRYTIFGTSFQAQGYSSTTTSITGYRSFAPMRAIPTLAYSNTIYVNASSLATLAVSEEGFSAKATGTTGGANSYFKTNWSAVAEL